MEDFCTAKAPCNILEGISALQKHYIENRKEFPLCKSTIFGNIMEFPCYKSTIFGNMEEFPYCKSIILKIGKNFHTAKALYWKYEGISALQKRYIWKYGRISMLQKHYIENVKEFPCCKSIILKTGRYFCTATTPYRPSLQSVLSASLSETETCAEFQFYRATI